MTFEKTWQNRALLALTLAPLVQLTEQVENTSFSIVGQVSIVSWSINQRLWGRILKRQLVTFGTQFVL